MPQDDSHASESDGDDTIKKPARESWKIVLIFL